MTKRKSLPIASAIILGLLLTTTACSSNSEAPAKSQSETTVEQKEELTIRAKSGEAFYVSATTSVPNQETTDLEILIPGGSLVVFATGTIESMPVQSQDIPQDVNWESDTAPDRPTEKFAAEGEEFFAFRSNLTTTLQTPSSYSLVVDGVTRELSSLESDNALTIISLPVDRKSVQLNVTFDGLVQTVDLTTGERISITAEGLYSGNALALLPEGGILHGEAPGQEGTVTLDATINKVNRDSWLPGQGWANKGDDTWLSVNLASVASWDYQTPNYSTHSSNQLQWKLVDGEGNEYLPDESSDATDVLFRVPAGQLSFTLSLSGTANTSHGTSGSQVLVASETNSVPITF